MCTWITTRSAWDFACFTSSAAFGRLSRSLAHEYGANPMTATLIPFTVTTVIIPGGPVYFTPAASNALRVFWWPAGPKSYAWLFARFTSAKPASLSTPAYDGGERNWKHVVLPAAPLPTPVSSGSG